MLEQSEMRICGRKGKRNSLFTKCKGMISSKCANRRRSNKMELMEKILDGKNFQEAIVRVKNNKGASGIDNMPVDVLKEYFEKNGKEIKLALWNKEYKPMPVRRVYIPKSNGKKRPLGIPTVVDRVVQQATAQVLSELYEPSFSEYSYGFRPNRDCHKAINKALEYLNDGYEWVVDFDIEKYFDTVSHDKLISILRERVKDDKTLHLVRSFLKAGVMEEGLTSPSREGVPQGGPLSPILSNIYLDKLDKELEARGLHFVRYADDFDVFVKSEMAADRVMKSITSWLERKLFLKVSATKTKVVRPTKSSFLGFTFWKNAQEWKVKPTDDRKRKLCEKVKEILKRKTASAKPLTVTFTKLNQVIRGWINYFRIGSMKQFLDNFSQWLRHKVRIVIVKQWKKPSTIYANLMKLNKAFRCNINEERVYWTANSRKGLYAQCHGDVISFLLSPKVLALPNRKEGRPGLIDPLAYYLSNCKS